MKEYMNNKKRQNSYRVLLLFLLLFTVFCLGMTHYNFQKVKNSSETYQSSGRTADEKLLIPCGLPVGIYVKTEGLLVLDSQVLIGQDGLSHEPAKNILRKDDYIKKVDGNIIESKEELKNIVENSNGRSLQVEILRNKKEKTVSVTPIMTNEGIYKLGIWLRDDTQGLGTITYIDGNHFGALGHGINDYDTGSQMEIKGGSLYRARILSVKKGERGNPGELVGQVEYVNASYLGKIESNSEEGIYGTLECDINNLVSCKPIPISEKKEVKKGKAYIQFQLDGQIKEYEINILKLDQSERNKKQGILFEICDKELLSRTGGVVQGMSGSPIIQDGKIVGAVTHVLVNDPTRGYGIFIVNMLDAAG